MNLLFNPARIRRNVAGPTQFRQPVTWASVSGDVARERAQHHSGEEATTRTSYQQRTSLRGRVPSREGTSSF